MRRLSLAVLAATALAACADIPTGASGSELDAAWQRWQHAGIADYRFDVQVVCFCIPDRTRTVTAVVVGGSPVSLFYADSGNAADTVMFADVRTMEHLFLTLSQDLQRRPYQFTASYHDSVGYPLDVWIDFEEMMADEEIGYRITNFMPLVFTFGSGESFRDRGPF